MREGSRTCASRARSAQQALRVRDAAASIAKLVLVGDHHQLPEIGAGGAFGGLVHRFEKHGRVERLLENRRQREAWERGTLAELPAGSTDAAIQNYVAKDRIVVDPNRDALRQRLVSDWLAAREVHPEVAMVAYTNRDVDALNQSVRTALDTRGLLGGDRITAGGREWSAGDELLCLRNDRRLGLANGTRGTVTHVDRDQLTITTADGTRHSIPRDYLEQGHTTYGWATTGHKAQGLTVNGEAFVLASEHVSREWIYVAMSRAKDASRIYVEAPSLDPSTRKPLSEEQRYAAAIAELSHLASRSAAQSLSAEHETSESRLSVADLRRLSSRHDLPSSDREGLATNRDRRMAQLRDRLVEQPPAYLLPLIGPVPLDREAQAQWTRDAARLEVHRRRLGLRPTAVTRETASRVLGRELGRGIGRER